MKALTKMNKAELEATYVELFNKKVPANSTNYQLMTAIGGKLEMDSMSMETFNTMDIEQSHYQLSYQDNDSVTEYSEAEALEAERQADIELEKELQHIGVHPKFIYAVDFMDTRHNAVESWDQVPSIDNRRFIGYSYSCYKGTKSIRLVAIDNHGRFFGLYSISHFNGQAVLTCWKNKAKIDEVSRDHSRYSHLLAALEELTDGLITEDKRWYDVEDIITPVEDKVELVEY